MVKLYIMETILYHTGIIKYWLVVQICIISSLFSAMLNLSISLLALQDWERLLSLWHFGVSVIWYCRLPTWNVWLHVLLAAVCIKGGWWVPLHADIFAKKLSILSPYVRNCYTLQSMQHSLNSMDTNIRTNSLYLY